MSSLAPMSLELYFAPLACSLATRISLYEIGAPAAGNCASRRWTRARSAFWTAPTSTP